jgi:hypothetical protein
MLKIRRKANGDGGVHSGAAEIAATFAWFDAYTDLGLDSSDRIALANKVAGWQPTKFSAWAQANLPVHESA